MVTFISTFIIGYILVRFILSNKSSPPKYKKNDIIAIPSSSEFLPDKRVIYRIKDIGKNNYLLENTRTPHFLVERDIKVVDYIYEKIS